MTPLPKKKHAKSRTRTRKATISLKMPNLVICPKCQGLKLSHRACPKCGYYRESKFPAPARTGLRESKFPAPARTGLKQDTK